MKKISTKTIPNGISRYRPELVLCYEKIASLIPPKNLLVVQKAGGKKNPYNVDLTIAEIELCRRLEQVSRISKFFKKKKSSPTNDFVWLSKPWELKTMISKSGKSIQYILWRVTDQNKRNIIVDTSYTTVSFSEILDMAYRHLTIFGNDRLIENLLIVRGDKIIRVK